MSPTRVLDEIVIYIRIMRISLETIRTRVPSLSFLRYIQWAREALSVPHHMLNVLSRRYLTLAREALNNRRAEVSRIGFTMIESFGNEEDESDEWWDDPQVSCPCFCLLL